MTAVAFQDPPHERMCKHRLQQPPHIHGGRCEWCWTYSSCQSDMAPSVLSKVKLVLRPVLRRWWAATAASCRRRPASSGRPAPLPRPSAEPWTADVPRVPALHFALQSEQALLVVSQPEQGAIRSVNKFMLSKIINDRPWSVCF